MEIEKLIERLKSWDGIKPDREIDAAIDGLKQLQAENDRLKADRDIAVSQLHGYCHVCKNYTANHNEGPCAGCKHEYFKYQNADARDNWEWNGGKENNL